MTALPLSPLPNFPPLLRPPPSPFPFDVPLSHDLRRESATCRLLAEWWFARETVMASSKRINAQVEKVTNKLQRRVQNDVTELNWHELVLMHYRWHRLTASVSTWLRARTRQTMTSGLVLLAHWSVRQKLNRVSSVQLRRFVCVLIMLQQL